MDTIKQVDSQVKRPNSISLPNDVWEKVDREAEKQKRSRNNMMEIIVDFFFSHNKAS